MTRQLDVPILPQPDEATCGPTCLHAVYRYYGDTVGLARLIEEIPTLRSGGTLGVLLGCHALDRGYRATLYTYNLQMFDPSWFSPEVDLAAKLRAQSEAKTDEKLRSATGAYLEFLERGGHVLFEDLTPALLARHLESGRPLLTGLSATYLYGSRREAPESSEYDDIAGHPMGHFVVLAGHDASRILVADPWNPNPESRSHRYWVDQHRLINSVMLGIVTYDANVLLLEPNQ